MAWSKIVARGSGHSAMPKKMLLASNRNNLNIGLKLRGELIWPVSLPDGTR